MKNLYEILQINKTASMDEIKKSFRKLALLYHPDKGGDTAKFQEIRTAYEILSDRKKRDNYDNMSVIDQHNLYHMLKGALIMLFPKMKILIDMLVKAYGDKKLENDINTYNFRNIYNTIIKEFSSSESPVIIKQEQIQTHAIVSCSLLERYCNKYKQLTCNNKKYNVPLCEDDVTYDDLDVTVECSDYKGFQQINYKDLYIVQKISLSEYLYGGTVVFNHIDDEVINITFGPQIDVIPCIIIKNKGIPRYMSKVRGNLFIHLKIDGINTGEESFKTLVKEAINLLF